MNIRVESRCTFRLSKRFFLLLGKQIGPARREHVSFVCFFLALVPICSFVMSVSSSPSQSSWVIQVELAIGPEEGISYLTDKGSTVSWRQSHSVFISNTPCKHFKNMI